MPSPHLDVRPADGAPARMNVGYFTRDLFFGVRIAEGLAKLALEGRAIAPDAPDVTGLALCIVDLSAPQPQWRPLIEAARRAGTPVLAFGSHMDQERWAAARQAGATRLVANSQLAERFAALVQQLIGAGGAEGGRG